MNFVSFNSFCNHTRDKQIELPLRGRPSLLSLVWLQTELDSVLLSLYTIKKSFSTSLERQENIFVFELFSVKAMAKFILGMVT